MEISELFALLGVDTRDLAKGGLVVRSPLDGAEIARLRTDSPADVENKVTLADDAFLQWRRVPVPRSGELIHLFGEQLRAFQDPLARLVSVECGKILQESLGEVREMNRTSATLPSACRTSFTASPLLASGPHTG